MSAPSPGIGHKLSRYSFVYLALCALVWIDFLEILRVEWSLNPVYEFGYLVPLLVGYLTYRRIRVRPLELTGVERSHLRWLIVGCVVLVLPIHLVRLANPDWRAVYWVYWVIAMVLTFTTLYFLYGPNQTRRVIPAAFLTLFAMPWPSGMEAALTQSLMSWVTVATVECINWMGIPALQQGQIIALPDAFVGVEEACSGVRSFQSSPMAAWFFGEFYRFSPIQRTLMLLLAPFIAFIVNIGRTLTLTHSIHHLGTADFEFMHDNTGWFSTGIAFILILLLAMAVRITFARWKPHPRQTRPPYSKATRIYTAPAWLWIALASIPLSRGAAHMWYEFHETRDADALITRPDWGALKTDLTFVDIPDNQRAMLRYTEGSRADWKRENGPSTIAYFFRWDAGRISSFAGVHSPEVCLPSVGHRLEEGPKTFVIPNEHGTITLKGYRFELALPGGRIIPRLVFFGVWDSDLQPAPVKVVGAAGRLKNVLAGERIRNRTSFQLIMTGPRSFEEGWPLARQEIEQILTFSPLE